MEIMNLILYACLAEKNLGGGGGDGPVFPLADIFGSEVISKFRYFFAQISTQL